VLECASRQEWMCGWVVRVRVCVTPGVVDGCGACWSACARSICLSRAFLVCSKLGCQRITRRATKHHTPTPRKYRSHTTSSGSLLATSPTPINTPPTLVVTLLPSHMCARTMHDVPSIRTARETKGRLASDTGVVPKWPVGTRVCSLVCVSECQGCILLGVEHGPVRRTSMRTRSRAEPLTITAASIEVGRIGPRRYIRRARRHGAATIVSSPAHRSTHQPTATKEGVGVWVPLDRNELEIIYSTSDCCRAERKHVCSPVGPVGPQCTTSRLTCTAYRQRRRGWPQARATFRNFRKGMEFVARGSFPSDIETLFQTSQNQFASSVLNQPSKLRVSRYELVIVLQKMKSHKPNTSHCIG
jgi:hypothetical protein